MKKGKDAKFKNRAETPRSESGNPAASGAVVDDEFESSTVEIDPEDEEFQITPSYIDPRTIRWMNKRRPNSVAQPNSRVSPTRIQQLRAIYKGFSSNENGKIELSQLKEAISYVQSHSPGVTFNERDLFNKLDSNHNGVIEFPEFIAAMTNDINDNEYGFSTAPVPSTASSPGRQTFFEFATRHRRQRILDKLSNSAYEDTKRYHQFSKLFDVKFFRDDEEMDEKVNIEAFLPTRFRKEFLFGL